MTKLSGEAEVRGVEAVEELLEMAPPRPVPPGKDEAVVRDAVYAEWQSVAGRVRTRQRMTYFAIAASVVIGVVVAFNALQVSNVPAVQVATISKSHGSIYLLGEQSVQQEMTDLASISAGQIIKTGDNAGIGLDWGKGGSLRIDENTQIEFTSAESVYLKFGRIYFDSKSSALTASITGGSRESVAGSTGSGFAIETDHGSVKHLGTQYMTAADTRNLTVSVREGRVEVDGAYVDKAVAEAGQQLKVSGGASPVVLDISGYGTDWDWIEATAPPVAFDGRTVHEFLTWIGRETGLQISYASPVAEQMAHNGVLRGDVSDMGPRDELAFRMAGEDLDYRIDGGTIYVSAIATRNRP